MSNFNSLNNMNVDNDNANKQAIDKWQSLNNEQRNKIVQRMHEVMDFSNPNFYFDCIKVENCMKAQLGEDAYTGLIQNPNPCLVLTCCDPLLSRILGKWMNTRIQVEDKDGTIIWNDRLPFAGFFLDEIYFNKSSLMQYTDEEKDIINKAISIIKNKGL